MQTTLSFQPRYNPPQTNHGIREIVSLEAAQAITTFLALFVAVIALVELAVR